MERLSEKPWKHPWRSPTDRREGSLDAFRPPHNIQIRLRSLPRTPFRTVSGRGILRSTGGEPLTCGPAEAGPSGVPEEHHAALSWHAPHPDEVPVLGLVGIEGFLNLLWDVRVQVQLLGVESSVAWLGHEVLLSCSSTTSVRVSSISNEKRTMPLSLPLSSKYRASSSW
jgi:hypothetical protein